MCHETILAFYAVDMWQNRNCRDAINGRETFVKSMRHWFSFRMVLASLNFLCRFFEHFIFSRKSLFHRSLHESNARILSHLILTIPRFVVCLQKIDEFAVRSEKNRNERKRKRRKKEISKRIRFRSIAASDDRIEAVRALFMVRESADRFSILSDVVNPPKFRSIHPTDLSKFSHFSIFRLSETASLIPTEPKKQDFFFDEIARLLANLLSLRCHSEKYRFVWTTVEWNNS